MSARAERRLAAILAADVAGYSRLMGEDEEGTLARLKAHRSELIDPKVAEHRGRIVKTTGDGALVEFASVVDAVRCAVEVQQAMAERNADVPDGNRIEFRIGINLGDVIIDDGDIYGDGVNVAARLEGLAEPGGIYISGSAYDQVKGKLPIACDDLGQKVVKNIAEPVRTYRVVPGTGARAPGGERPSLPLPDRPSIAVLPFQNMSGDPEQEYFADGVAEDIITALSRFRWFFVIARNSSFTYKGKAVDVRQVGRELGVRYVLEGSVRKGGSRLRLTAQLVEAATGNHLWAEKYDGALEDVFELQDKITEGVVGAIEPHLRSAEIARAKAKPTENLAAYDMYLRALPEFYTFTEEGLRRAETLLRGAVSRDPDYAEAWATLADCTARQINMAFVKNIEDAVADNRQAALRAVQCDPENGFVLSSAAFSLGIISGEFDRALELCEQALRLQPNSAQVLTNCGWVFVNGDQTDRAIDCLNKAQRLNPLDPRMHTTLTAMAAAHFYAGRFADAEREARRAIENHPVALRFLAAALARMDRVEEARAVVAELLRRSPGSRVAQSRRLGLKNPAKREMLIDALTKAGLPE